MANQGNQGQHGNQDQPNNPSEGNREREGNIGQPSDINNPTGTSGRQSGSDTGIGDDNPPRRTPRNDDEESALGNRNTFR